MTAATLFDHPPEPPREWTCPTCEHVHRNYRHRMDYSKWVVLCRIAELNRSGVEWVKVQRDGDLIKDAAEEV